MNDKKSAKVSGDELNKTANYIAFLLVVTNIFWNG